jgi:hypothetical protein
MKLLQQGARLAVLAALMASSASVSAIEGLQISVQCPDVVLGWPSTSGEYYIVQWRPTLDSSTPWVTLTNSLPADDTTNWTIFVHSNQVQCASGGTNGGGTNSFGGGGGSPPTPSLATMATSTAQILGPLARPADGSGSPVPLCIYPPGFDLSGFIVFDPPSGEWLSGSGYTIRQPSLKRPQPNPNDPDPQDDPIPPNPGFYQVVRDGVHVVGLSNLTSGPLSNTIVLSFEAGNPVGMLQEVYPLVDGAPCRGATGLLGPPFYPGTITLDTAFLENGDHTLQLEASWRNPDLDDRNSFTFTRISDPVTITVSNVIYYPDWEEEMGEYGFSAYFAKTTCTNADWQIDIYDVRSNLVQALAGHTDDGIIETYWDLVDTNGVIRTNLDLDPEFSAIITVADPVRKPLPKKRPVRPYPIHGQWVIAYQDTFSFCASSNSYYEAIYDFGGMASQFGGAVTYFPSSPTNGQSFPLRYPYTNPVVNVSAATMLLDDHALRSLLTETNSRNFYYNGHGTANTFAGFLTSSIIANDLRGRYYRFVFLDACLTANGSLPASFGISSTTTQPLSYYQKRGIHPRAFLGYDHAAWYTERGNFYDPYDGGTYQCRVKEEVWEFLVNFEAFWQFGYFGSDLASALYNAYSYTPSLPYGWQNGNGLRLYGYSGLGIDDYNWY